MHRDGLVRFVIDLSEFIFRQKGTKLVVHRWGEDNAESTKQLAEDLMAITTVFAENNHGQRAAEGRRRRKLAREEEEENLKMKGGGNIYHPHGTRKVRVFPRPHGDSKTMVWCRLPCLQYCRFHGQVL